ncbi:MAG: glucose-6-phosphate isomerase [Candidatus Margulisbacteria bacterium]|nr:glucose-6-phosphate isomerase [Candidatus Margulisiibacteriota bacterium]
MANKIVARKEKRLIELAEWNVLKQMQQLINKKGINIADLYKIEPQRMQAMTHELENMYADFSKNSVTLEIMEALNNLARAAEVEKWRDLMYSGAKINFTENRAVLHVALRNVDYINNKFVPKSSILVDGKNVMPEVAAVLNHMAEFTDRVRSGQWLGATGKPIKAIVNIGIGGSDLGPRMITKTLKAYGKDGLAMHFVSNIDGTDITEVLKQVDPETTLFIIESKTFTTEETMTNAKTAKDWFLKRFNQEDIARHFVAASTAKELVEKFGIDPQNMFPFWDWVGGRYSAPSAIGLPVMLSIGKDNYADFLKGYNVMDEHFKTAPIEKNIPMQMALIGLWYNNFMGFQSYAVLPYDQYSELFPSYLQQLDMESNGKYVNRFGEAVNYATGPVLWGAAGTNGQHSFYQLLHQSADKIIPADFIGYLRSLNPVGDHHVKLMANFLAQPEALMNGLSSEELVKSGCPANLVPHRTFKGNRPSNTIVFDKLTPKTLGMQIALYEHKVFTQGIIWQINSLDQYGVELGKKLAGKIRDQIKAGQAGEHDPSTTALMNRLLGVNK